jgi:hypothetical protein
MQCPTARQGPVPVRGAAVQVLQVLQVLQVPQVPAAEAGQPAGELFARMTCVRAVPSS